MSVTLEAKPGEVSVYGQGSISPTTSAREMKKIRDAFPKISDGWYSVLSMQLKANGFTDERLTSAVNDLIATCEYPEPTIARILAFDRKVTFLDYPAMCEKWAQGLGKFYRMVRRADPTHQPLWASTDDVERYHLPVVEREEHNPQGATPRAPREVPASKEVVEKVRAEMDALTMKAKTRLSREAFEANRKRAQEALRSATDEHANQEAEREQ